MLTLQSNMLTVVDQTDNRKLEVYIKSNMPTAQIYNSNTGAYSPDWRSGFELTADVYLDSRDIESYEKVSFQWSVDDGTNVTEVSKSRTYRTTSNALASKPILTYICVASYQNISATSRITFTRTDTGLNGKDGTGITVKGTATSVTVIPETDYYTITYEGSDISSAQLNDSYIYNGDLYVCVDSRDGIDYFINVGRIQGPKGEDAKTIILTGNAQVFKGSTTTPIIYTPSIIRLTANRVNIPSTDILSWSYNNNDNNGWTAVKPDCVVINGDTATITGSLMTSNSLTIKVSDGTVEDIFTVYRAFDGKDGEKGDVGNDAPIVFLSNEHISFVADANGNVGNQTIITRVVGYRGTAKEQPVIGDLTATNAGLEVIGMNIEVDEETTKQLIDEVALKISVKSKIGDNLNNLGSALSNNGDFSIPVVSPASVSLQLNWTKVNAGPEGEKGADGSNFKTFTTEYETSQTNIDNWAKLESSEWSVNESTSGVKVGDTVMLRCYNTTKQGYSYIVATVISIPGDKVIHTKSIGLLDKGDSGSPASLVDITPSALYFKSTTGANGTFTPQYIYLYPRFQNATYQGWQYSRDGGVSWQDVVSGLNWLLIDTFDSVPHSLRIDRGSTLYTDTITSISFRCNSTIQGVYDTISIAKIYDVVDLQIGGRNLIRWTQGLPITSTHNGPDGVSVYSSNTSAILTPTDVGLKLTFDSTTHACMSIPLASDGCVENGELYTLSFDYRGNITQPGLLYFLQRTTPNVNLNLSSTSSLVANETEWQHYEVTFSSSSLNARINYQILLFYGLSSYTADNWIEIKKESLKLEKGNKKTAWTPAIEDNVGTPGAAGADAVTFQIYSSNGYALSANTPTVTLQTFAYIGDIAIQAGATYQWYQYNNSSWVAISGATNAYLTVSRDDVTLSNNYMCKMQFNNVEYVGVVTIDDKSDVNKVFTSKPSNYVIGDLWIVGVDYVPAGVEVGTLLKAEHTSNAYVDADWVAATKYDDKINELQSNIDTYNQYFSFDSGTGLKISAKDANGTPSQFSTSLTNERLSFNYGNESIAYINGTKMNIKEAEIESPLTVTGKYSGSTMLQAPIINIGNFSIVVESNGSLSIITNT